MGLYNITCIDTFNVCSGKKRSVKIFNKIEDNENNLKKDFEYEELDNLDPNFDFSIQLDNFYSLYKKIISDSYTKSIMVDIFMNNLKIETIRVSVPTSFIYLESYKYDKSTKPSGFVFGYPLNYFNLFNSNGVVIHHTKRISNTERRTAITRFKTYQIKLPVVYDELIYNCKDLTVRDIHIQLLPKEILDHISIRNFRENVSPKFMFIKIK